MSEILDRLRQDIDNFPKDASDINNITAVIVNEYTNVKLTLDTLYRSATLIQTDMISAMPLITNESVSAILKHLNDLNAIVNKTRDFEYKIHPSVDVTDDMTREEQIRFMGSIPENLFNLFQIFKYYKPEDKVDMPSFMAQSIKASMKISKDDALIGLLGNYYNDIVFPFIEYQSYIDSNDVRQLIDKLANIELFLIPKYTTSRNFIADDGYIFSAHYERIYMINPEGKIALNRLTSDKATISQIHNILANIELYYS